MTAPSKIGIFTNNPQAIFQRTVIGGIREVSAQQDCSIHIFAEASESEIQQHLTTLDGVLVIANVIPNPMLREIYSAGKPISLVSHEVPDVPIPVVTSNNAQGIAELMRHLVTVCGRRDLIFIRGLTDQKDGREREEAFRQEIMRYNLHVPETHFVRGDFSPTEAAASIQGLIRSGAKFDGILASDYMMAIAAIDTLRAAGIAVPGDVSVVGFGDAPEAEAAGLITVAASITALGRCAAKQLISQIKGLPISGTTVLSVQLIVRGPC